MKSATKLRRWLPFAVLGAAMAVLLVSRREKDGAGVRWYGLVYRAAYRLGLTVWERRNPPADLVELVEGSSALSAGRALDLGCGTGTDSVYLAIHGWEVTGVDMVSEALVAARRRAVVAGVSLRLVEGDVTRLRELGVGEGYSLVLDFGCFHTLPDDRRDAYIKSVSRAVAPDATLLLYGFSRPPKLAPMHSGVTTNEVARRFGGSGWELVGAERMSADAIEVAGRRVDDRFELWRYRLRHLAHTHPS
jgi:SAM-dependent methyltransferase